MDKATQRQVDFFIGIQKIFAESAKIAVRGFIETMKIMGTSAKTAYNETMKDVVTAQIAQLINSGKDLERAIKKKAFSYTYANPVTAHEAFWKISRIVYVFAVIGLNKKRIIQELQSKSFKELEGLHCKGCFRKNTKS